MKKRLTALALAALMTAGCLSGCGGGGETTDEGASTESTGSEIVINYPTFQCGVNTASPVVDQLIEEFNAEYAGKYRIQKEDVPGDANYVDKIKVQLGTGDLPPVVYGGGYNLLDLALAKDVVVDLTPYVEADPEWKALYSDVALTTNSRDGKMLCIFVRGQPGRLLLQQGSVRTGWHRRTGNHLGRVLAAVR